MTVKASKFRQNLFHYLDHCRDTGAAVHIQRGKDRFRLVPEGMKKPIGSGTVRLGVADDLETLPEYSPAVWEPRDIS